MGKKIVIDTNNLISALGWGGKSKELIERVLKREYELFISLKQIMEIKRVMEYPKFEFTKEQKNRFLKILFEIANIIDTKINLNIIKEDTDDNVLIECAVEADADYIISGDKHLKKLKQFKNIKILSVKEFLEILI